MSHALPPILLVGFGKMGGAMLAGWREQGLTRAVAVDPTNPTPPGADVLVVPDAGSVPADFTPAAVVLAVKPQMAPDTLPLYRRFAGKAVMLSIMAGRPIGFMQDMLGADAAIVRAMPNTPAAVRQGVTVACAGPGVADDQRALCDRLLHAIGSVAWTEDESLMDAVTAVSGSGPAYVFLLAELMEQAGIEQGLPPDLARKLARETVAGSGALLAASPEDAGQLRRNVTSPNGTTQAALEVLMAASAWPDAVSRAIAATTARSRALAG